MKPKTSEEEHPKSFYEFYIKGPNVFGVGYRPFIADELYNKELPGRPMNDKEDAANGVQEIYVGVYGSEPRVKCLYERLRTHKPSNAEVTKVTPPVKTSSPKYEIPQNLNDMHIYMAYLNLHQTSKGVDHLINIEETLTEIKGLFSDLPKNIAKAITGK